jgi:hypothetical protein
MTYIVYIYFSGHYVYICNLLNCSIQPTAENIHKHSIDMSYSQTVIESLYQPFKHLTNTCTIVYIYMYLSGFLGK